jgi:hypothetical protein
MSNNLIVSSLLDRNAIWNVEGEAAPLIVAIAAGTAAILPTICFIVRFYSTTISAISC